jgi:hypothetical protein
MLDSFMCDLLMAARLCGGLIRYMYEISYTLYRNLTKNPNNAVWKTGDDSEF